MNWVKNEMLIKVNWQELRQMNPYLKMEDYEGISVNNLLKNIEKSLKNS